MGNKKNENCCHKAESHNFDGTCKHKKIWDCSVDDNVGMSFFYLFWDRKKMLSNI